MQRRYAILARMNIDDLRRSIVQRLYQIDEEAEHLRALLALYGDGADAHQRSNATDEAASPRSKRTRSIPADARPLYAFAAGRRGDVTLDELEEFATSRGLPFDRPRIRAMMHNWKAREFFENPAQGVFRVTQKGLAELENDDGASPWGPAPSSEIESSDEPEVRETDRFDLLHHNAA
jgi:hypothetical protein